MSTWPLLSLWSPSCMGRELAGILGVTQAGRELGDEIMPLLIFHFMKGTAHCRISSKGLCSYAWLRNLTVWWLLENRGPSWILQHSPMHKQTLPHICGTAANHSYMKKGSHSFHPKVLSDWFVSLWTGPYLLGPSMIQIWLHPHLASLMQNSKIMLGEHLLPDNHAISGTVLRLRKAGRVNRWIGKWKSLDDMNLALFICHMLNRYPSPPSVWGAQTEA